MGGERLEELAARLREAEAAGRPLAGVAEAYPALTAAEGYAVQFANARWRLEGVRRVGWKAALTSRATQENLNVRSPACGHLFADQLVGPDGLIALGGLIAPRVEGEIAFVLDRPLRGHGVTVPAVLAATRGVMAAIEVPDCRLEGWRIRAGDIAADNAAASRFALGGALVPLGDFDLRLLGMVLTVNGEIACTATGAAVLGHPAAAVAWLANHLAAHETGLAAGDIVLAGSLGPAPFVKAGDVVTAEFDRLGVVTVAFRG